jgi:hypothetical protein
MPWNIEVHKIKEERKKKINKGIEINLVYA